jgi:ABC-2 type transport system ATP-binding protein
MHDYPVAVEVQNLTKIYSPKNSKKALDEIHLNVPLGQTMCLVGPNGSGKTTLLKVIAGLVTPTSGTVNIMGMDSQKEPLKIRRHIGWMPADERSGFYGRLSGFQNLKFFATLQKISNEEFDRQLGNLFLQLGIQGEIKEQTLQISAGLRQKMGLIRTMIHNPSVLLLDEPFRNLDPHTVHRFRRLLKDHINRIQKRTVILSTHLLEEARRVADIVVFLSNGRIVKELAARDLANEIRNKSIEEYYLELIQLEKEK